MTGADCALLFGTASDPLLRAALWIGTGAFASSIALVFVVLALRLSLRRRQERGRRIAQRWQPLLAECALQVPETSVPLRRGEASIFLRLWCQAQESLRGQAQGNLVELATRIGAPAHVRRLLDGRSTRRHLLALVAAGHMGLRDQLPRLNVLITDSATLPSLLAAQAALRIDARQCLPRIIAEAARRTDWPIARIAGMLGEADAEQVGPYLAAALQSELAGRRGGPGVARLLRLHRTAYASSVEPIIVEILSQTRADPENLVAAIGAVWDPMQIAWLRRHAAHPEWIVRAAAARALGRLGSRSEAETLASLLADRSWWVRYRAAQSLAALPGLGPEDLIAIRRRLHDRYALDMLAQAIADKAAA